MSAFCVFGVSKTICKKAAERKTPTFEKVGAGADRVMNYYTMAEWAEKRDAMTAKLFDEKTRLTQVSPKFDAPQFCRDWLALDPKHTEIRNAVIMVRGHKIDKRGDKVKRSGAFVMAWLEYDEKNKCAKAPS